MVRGGGGEVGLGVALEVVVGVRIVNRLGGRVDGVQGEIEDSQETRHSVVAKNVGQDWQCAFEDWLVHDFVRWM